MYTPREAIFACVTGLFVLYILYFGFSNSGETGLSFGSSVTSMPDFGQYKPLATIPDEDFPLDDSDRRVILVGDVHGMNRSFHSLLGKLSYDPSQDILVHVGDILAKGPHKGSMAVLSYMAANNVTGVRGNHDQRIIEWRAWRDWMRSTVAGRRWLEAIDKRWLRAHARGIDTQAWVKKERKRNPSKWWSMIPEGWKLFSDHYRIARQMSDGEYDYLRSLPLKIHVPSAHLYIVHAGLLASDPRYRSNNHRQPLSKMPVLAESSKGKDVNQLRLAQEKAILLVVPQNSDPWANLNMRGYHKHDITRKNKGTPWSELWAEDMKSCNGFEKTLTSGKRSLYCLPSTVFYGHAAARGLDVKRWSLGLDTGCVYQRRMTALELGAGVDKQSQPVDWDETEDDHEPDWDEEWDDSLLADDEDEGTSTNLNKNKGKSSVIPFGDKDYGRLVSAKCH